MKFCVSARLNHFLKRRREKHHPPLFTYPRWHREESDTQDYVGISVEQNVKDQNQEFCVSARFNRLLKGSREKHHPPLFTCSR